MSKLSFHEYQLQARSVDRAFFVPAKLVQFRQEGRAVTDPACKLLMQHHALRVTVEDAVEQEFVRPMRLRAEQNLRTEQEQLSFAGVDLGLQDVERLVFVPHLRGHAGQLVPHAGRVG